MNELFAKDELKLLGGFYLEISLSSLIYFAPAFWIIYFNEALGTTQISILFAAHAFAILFFEMPTGAFADLFGRKASTLFAYLMIGLLLPTFLFATDFYLLLGLFFLWGFFETFWSGAREAWTVDNLKYHQRDDLIERYYLKAHALLRAGMFLSGFLGAFMVARFGIQSIWIFAALSWLLSFCFLLPVAEHQVTIVKKISIQAMHRQAMAAIRYSLKHKMLLFLLLATFFFMIRNAFGGELIWQPFLKDLGLPVHAFGYLFSATMISGSLAPFLAAPMLKICKTTKNYLSLLLVAGMLLNFGALFTTHFLTGAILVLALLFLIDLFLPVVNSLTQKFIPSQSRASVNSFKSMVISLAYATSYPLAGWVADNFGSQHTLVLGGLFLLPALYFFKTINA